MNGQVDNLPLHNERMNRSRRDIFGCQNTINLEKYTSFPVECSQGCWRWRITYNESIQTCEHLPYKKRIINQLNIVNGDNLTYNYKFLDRSGINELTAGLQTDNDIIILKNELVTDSSFSNLAFFNGTDWLTPKNPLLEGTRRKQLVNDSRIIPYQIRLTDLNKFSHIMLINAMLDFEEFVLPVSAVKGL